MCRVFCSGAPKGVEFNSVKEVLLSLKAVKAMHSLHLWALTLGHSLISVHIAIGKYILKNVFYRQIIIWMYLSCLTLNNFTG